MTDALDLLTEAQGAAGVSIPGEERTSSRPSSSGRWPVGTKDEMARLGIEPRTPRFSDGGENPWLTTDLQDFFW